MSVEIIELQNENDLRITEASKLYLLEAVKWSKFIAIVGLIGIGILVLIGMGLGIVFSKNDMSTVPGMESLAALGSTFIMILYIIIALIYYFPLKYLYDFSVKIKLAITNSDTFVLEEAFLKLKSLNKYIGIVAIVLLSFYGLMFIFGILGGLVGAML